MSDGRYDATGIECGTTCPISTNQFPTYEDNSIDGATYVDSIASNTAALVEGFSGGAIACRPDA